MKHITTLLVLMSVVLPGLAQQRITQPLVSQETSQTVSQEDDGPRVIEVTSRINKRLEAREALQRFHQARMAGDLPAAGKMLQVYDLGDTADFNVIVNINNSNEIDWESKEFVLKAASDGSDPALVNIWVETGQIESNNVNDGQITSLLDALVNHTPSRSYNPNQGIIANNNEIFGSPPDVDGDGRLDVLLYDITEGTEDCCVLGYVVSTDLFPSAGKGNGRDILYLDTKPGRSQMQIQNLLSVAAHEYQHLIHFAYDIAEETFVNEGLSEWATVLNGYFPLRSFRYLTDPVEHNRRLLGWRSGDEITQVDRDYQRAGLFTSYIAQRVGPQVTGSIVDSRDTNGGPAHGAAAYQRALEQGSGLPTLEEIVEDFHTANILNDQAIDERFGYEDVTYAGVEANPSAHFDGRVDSDTPTELVTIEAGGVQYLVWEQVNDLVLNLDVEGSPSVISTRRTYLAPRAVLEYHDGSVDIRDDIALGPDPVLFEGSFARVSLVIPHVKPALAAVDLVYSATWSRGSQQYLVETRSYDTNAFVDTLFFTLSAREEGAVATRFVVPKSSQTILDKVSVAPLFLSHFEGQGQPPDAVRDFVLKVWASNGNGAPGPELFSLDVEDTRGGPPLITPIDFLSINLANYAEELSDLPDTIFVGYTEHGGDTNFMVVGVSPYQTENVSYVLNNRWTPLWEVRFQGSGDGEFPVKSTVIPIRVSFLVSGTPVASEGEAELPSEITLHQNYPNPFNPETVIRYSLPRTTDVQLVVYDVIGRRVATLVDTTIPAGSHEVRIDASGWSSGLYFYTLWAEGRAFTQKMMLIR